MPYIGQPPVTGDTTSSFRLLDNIASYTLTFDGSSAEVVSVANDTLTFSQHRFVTGQRVTYNDGGGTAIGGLSNGVYFIIKVDQNTISLATNASNAAAGTAIDLTGLGVGTTHTLNIAFDSVNTKFKATYENGKKAKLSRAGQLMISMNGVIQQPQETATPSVGFGLDSDSTIVFSTAPSATDVAFGNVLANSIATFDISDNTVDNFTGDGSTASFNLSKAPADNNSILVTLDGVIQYPTDSSTERAYSVTESTLTFVTAPANSVAIQVRHIGFAGAVTSEVSGFYGRTGNVSLKTTDHIVVGNINSAGVITATSFSGDGSGLTGVASTDNIRTNTNATFLQNINVTGIVTATTGNYSGTVTANAFSGDGSALTGITQTTINNNADNRVITGSDTANTLEAESGLTYTGSLLTVTGDIVPEADATRDLGSPSARWANIYSADIQMSNEGFSNEVDGTWGKYTIQEGENDLFLINRRTGKKYKFMLQEVE